MIDTIDADDAWWPPTFKPEGFGRTRFAWWMIALDSQSTRLSISRRVSYSPVTRRALSAVLVMAHHPSTRCLTF
jgi:hypothetical protein